jgi:hypothetical protein
MAKVPATIDGMTMRSTPFAAGAAALAMMLTTAAPAFALCTICNSTIRLDSGLATCFANRAADELKTLQQSGKSFVIVDLSDCETRGSLPTGNATGAPALLLDKQFVADAAGLKCLSDQIAAADDTTLDPSHVFDLAKDCPAQ